MRISDWSSDVCSSDLLLRQEHIDAVAGEDKACDPFFLRDAHRDRAHAGAERRGQEAAIVGMNERALGQRFAGRDRIADDRADQRVRVGLVLQEIGLFRSEEHTSELQSLMRISYAVFCLKKKTVKKTCTTNQYRTSK